MRSNTKETKKEEENSIISRLTTLPSELIPAIFKRIPKESTVGFLQSSKIIKSAITEKDIRKHPEFVIKINDGRLLCEYKLSSDGRHIFTGKRFTNTINMWDVVTGNLVHTFPIQDQMTTFTISSNDKYLAIGLASIDSRGQSIQLWDIETKTPVNLDSEHAHIASIQSLVFSPNSQLLCSVGMHESIKMWDLSNLKQKYEIQFDSYNVNVKVEFSPNQAFIAAIQMDNEDPVDDDYSTKINLYYAENGALHSSWNSHTQVIGDFVFTPDNKYVVSISDDKKINFWNTISKKTTKSLLDTIPLKFVSISNNGKYLATASLQDIHLWNLETGQSQTLEKGDFALQLTNMCFALKDQFLIAGDESRHVFIWNTKTGKLVQSLGPFAGSVHRVATIGSTLVVSTKRGLIRIWSGLLESLLPSYGGKQTYEYKGKTYPIKVGRNGGYYILIGAKKHYLPRHA
jgi:WD40 repeat protein